MTNGARSLFTFALVTTVVGLATAAATAKGASLEAIADGIIQEAVVALGSGMWLMLSQITGIVAAALGVLLLADFALSFAPAAEEQVFSALGNQGTQENIQEARQRIETCLLTDTPNVITAFNELVRGAISVAASDIHMSPTPEGMRITYRVHGSLHDVLSLPLDLSARLTARAKVLAQLDTHVRGVPQDGRLVVYLDGGSIDARVSCLPTEVGERVVLRLVRGSRRVPEMEALGFNDAVLRGLREVLARPQGLLFVTAPVGSGKTTTLYASLQNIIATRGTTTSIVTLEDPIEIELPFATQTQMHARSGMTFAATLRSVLRQDPNVLMVGEIRDRETADVAMQAGLTGHLILTTVHGENAAAPFARLSELQVEPFVLASATVGSLSQRLVRTLCTACRREAPPEAAAVERFSQHGVVVPPGRYFEPVGCDFCEGQGFTGRVPIAELLIVGPEIRKAIHDHVATNEIYALAVANGMTPLVRDGFARAQRGETSLSEVLRVAG